jgi:hypothetical protein
MEHNNLIAPDLTVHDAFAQAIHNQTVAPVNSAAVPALEENSQGDAEKALQHVRTD